MLTRVLTVAIIAGAAYWYWTGPYQDRVNPGYNESLQRNNEAMADCIKRKKYAASRTQQHAGKLEDICAAQLNLYFDQGQWYSYDQERKN